MSNPFMPTKRQTTAQMNGSVNPMQMAQDFRQFAMGFKGNPKEEVQKLLDSGEMTQEQYQFYMAQIQQRFPFMGQR